MLTLFRERHSIRPLALVLFVCLLGVVNVDGRVAVDPRFAKITQPTDLYTKLAFCEAQHDIGKIRLIASNFGQFGQLGLGFTGRSCITNQPFQSSAYPPGSHAIAGMRAKIWIGAIVDGDTLVSGTHWTEFTPDLSPWGEIVHRSIIDPNKPEFNNAISEQDFLAEYTDTLVLEFSYDTDNNRPHRPLGIKIEQNSYAWSYDYAEDFVLFQYNIENIGAERLRELYIGFRMDADVFQSWSFFDHNYVGNYEDDIVGSLYEHTIEYSGCSWLDTLNLAWFADNDGDFSIVDDTTFPTPHMGGIRVIRTPADSLAVNFNWWVDNYKSNFNWGPQSKHNFRTFAHGGTGSPATEQEKYFLMANGEHDYDQIFTSLIQPTDPIWAYPNRDLADDISNGQDVYMLLSFGPFNIEPGQTLPVSFAVVMGEDFHRDPYNGPKNLTDGYHPKEYMRNVYFDDIVKNAMWASWIYDNPGVDTDGDGYFGKSRICCSDSTITYIDSSPPRWDTGYVYNDCKEVYYEGDGVPDFRGASPPPAPKVWLEPDVGKIRVRWNGANSETTPDIFTRKIDFEGYRVHFALDARESSYSLLASYDLENYDKQTWNSVARIWEIIDAPFTTNELACLYGDSCFSDFDPLSYSRISPLLLPDFPDSIFFFSKHENNMFKLGRSTPIRKVYPNEPYPQTLIIEDAPSISLTDEGYLKYFEYEFTIENILPTVQYYVAVTTFDYGSPKSGLSPLETSKTLNAQRAFALPTTEVVKREGLAVYVYPNPYLITGNYRADGFEGRDATLYIPERDRRIHFANLPAKCTIGIYSIDGDRIKTFEHDMNPDAPDAAQDEWDMITRNTQLITTGIYYWTVTDQNGKTQIGKFVVIK